jgi:hypothetical protein
VRSDGYAGRIKKGSILGFTCVVACGCKNPLKCGECDGGAMVEKFADVGELRDWLGLPKLKAK